MTKITNKTPHPYDIHTKEGVKVISAFGTLEAEFDPAYLDLIKLSFDVEEVTEERDDAEDLSGPRGNKTGGEGSESHGKEDTRSGFDSAGQRAEQDEGEQLGSEGKAEYEALTGKKPDGRWSEERVLAEIAKLKG